MTQHLSGSLGEDGTRFLWIWSSGQTRVLADLAEDHGLVYSNHKAAASIQSYGFWRPLLASIGTTYAHDMHTNSRWRHQSLLKKNVDPRLLPACLFFLSGSFSPSHFSPGPSQGPLAERCSSIKAFSTTLGALLPSVSLRHFLQLGVKGWDLPRFGWDTAMDLCGTDVDVMAGWRFT